MIVSPCVSVCRIDEARGFCVGCGRTRAEIAAWLGQSDDWRQSAIRQASARLAPAPQRRWRLAKWLRPRSCRMPRR